MSPDPGPLLLDNCSALAARDPRLAGLILASVPDPSIEFLTARTGDPVPAQRGPDGVFPFHSRYDPRKEASRQESAWTGAGFIVVIGLGGGYHVSAMLRSNRVCGVLVVEKDLAVLRALFEKIPLREIAADPRTWFVAGIRELAMRVSDLWQPGLMGGLQTFALRPWCARQAAFCDEAARIVSRAVDDARADYSVQARFGKRWFVNMLHNITAAALREPEPDRLAPAPAVRVAAAGPSLEDQIGRLATAGAEGPLLAVDTALPALVQAGIRPDAVVSIDCQIHGYHHFMQGMPRGTDLYVDLASPPLLARGRQGMHFVAGNHPFARWLRARRVRLPYVDTSGGNVTHAAVSLALAMGAGRITLYGADFSYPRGKPYARGTYVYDVFGDVARRTEPVEAAVYAFILRSSDARAEPSGGHLRYRTGLLSSYRERLLAYVAGSGARLVAVPGQGLPLDVSFNGGASPPSGEDGRALSESAGVPAAEWCNVLEQYAESLARLPGLADPPWASLAAMQPAQIEAWGTLLPVAACVARETRGIGESAALESARRWALDRVTRTLGARSPFGQE